MIQVKNLGISFAGYEVFSEVSFNINRSEKIGLIGRNGSGKSTFLKILLQQLEADEGQIQIPKGYSIGYLQQHINFQQATVLDEIDSVLPEERKHELWKGEDILYGLGFKYEDFSKDPKQFSGGYQVKLNLAKLLLIEPQMLLLDEPTNYLDIYSIRWLKKFLQDWRQELVLITHDAGFMDEIITHTLIIHRGNFRKFVGNTQGIREKIAEEEEIQEKTRINQEKQRQKTQEWIDSFKAKASFASRAQSKVKMLEKQELIEKLDNINDLDFVFNCKPFASKENLLEIERISFSYQENNRLINDLSFKVASGEKIAIIGKNGKGKSTLLKLIAKELQPIRGNIKSHSKTEIAFFGQMNIDRLNANLTIYEELERTNKDTTQSRIRQVASHMMFNKDMVNKRISMLSGGEKSRVMLGKILLQGANLLLLDEPTNHLDFQSCQALIGAIKDFEGAVVLVSHDEGMLQQIATKLVVFDNNKTFTFENDYDSFLKKIGWQDDIY